MSSKKNNLQQEIGNRTVHDECDLIEMVNNLRNKLAAYEMEDISLPQIVVVGGQSSGKSSVLENLIGREFLPRGDKKVTRRPTVVQLQPNDEVLKLSFVDMPGIFKITVDNQPEEDIEYVRNMTMKYIEQPTSIILAVCPANQDFTTSDALEIAKIVDPNRLRTIGVLTKLDLMDADTDARDILENKIVPLAKGYVGVRNRSQQEINEKRDIKHSLEEEKGFFEKHPVYSHMADVMGSPYLLKFLHDELKKEIRNNLHAVRTELKQKLNIAQSKLREFDATMNFEKENSNAVQAYLFKLVQEFIDDIQTKLFGNSENVSMDTLEVGAVINYKLYTDIQKILEMQTNLKDEELITLMGNEHGIGNTLSISSAALEAACCKILKKYIAPLKSFVDSITELLISCVEKSSNSMSSYPHLQSVLVNLINEAIKKATIETKELLYKHIKAEMMYCNIYHWDFNNSKFEKGLLCSPVKIWTSFPEKTINPVSGNNLILYSNYIKGQLKENANAKKNAKILADLVKEYMQVIQKHIGDVTLKYIMCFLVKQVAEYIKNSLMIKLMTCDDMKSLMKECERDFRIRDDMLSTCVDLEESLNLVQSF